MAWTNLSQVASTGNTTVLFRMGYEVVDQYISNGVAYSKVNVRVQTSRTTTAIGTYKYSTPYTLTVDGSKTSGTISYDIRNLSVNTWQTIITLNNKVVTHDTLGNKNLTIAFTLDLSGTTTKSGSDSKTVALPQIPMGSVVSLDASSYTISNSTGPTATATITIYNLDYYHKITWSIGSYSVSTNLGKFNSTPQTSTRALTASNWLAQMTTSATGTGICKLQTYSDSGYQNQIGVDSVVNFTVVCARTPSIGSATAACAGSYIGSTYIGGYSSAKITASSVAGINGSTVAKYEFLQDGIIKSTVNSSSSSNNWTSDILPAGTYVFSVRVTDSRGITKTSSDINVTVAEYATPAISSPSIYRCLQNGTEDDEGTYISVKGVATATPSVNSISTFKVYTKLVTSSSWTNKGNVDKTGTTASIISSYDVTLAYDVKLEAVDALGSVSTYNKRIPTAAYTMDFKAGGKGVAFGKVAQTDNLLESTWPLQVNDNISASGQIMSTKTGKGVNSAILASNGVANTDTTVTAYRSDIQKGIGFMISTAGNMGLRYYNGGTDAWVCYYNGTRLYFSVPIYFRMYGNNVTNYTSYTLPSSGDITSNYTYNILTDNPNQFTAGRDNTGADGESWTYLDSFSTGSYLDIAMNKYGRFCVMSLTTARGASTSTSGNILKVTLKSAYRPTTTVYATGCSGTNNILGKITTDGVLTVAPLNASLAANTRVTLTFAYLASS